MENTENTRTIKFSSFFLFMCFMGAFAGGFAVAMQTQTTDPVLAELNPIYVFLIGFAPVMLFAVLIIFGFKSNGHKQLPIK